MSEKQLIEDADLIINKIVRISCSTENSRRIAGLKHLVIR